MKKAAFLLLLLLLAAGVVAWRDERVQRYVESEPPRIELGEQAGIGLSTTPRTTSMRISDNLSGIREATIVLKQGENEETLLSRSFDPPVLSETLEWTVPGAEKKLQEGTAEIVIRVRDASLRRNVGEIRVSAPVDRKPPRVSMLSLQHIGRQGGSQLVVFRAQDEHLERVGVEVAGRPIEAIRLSKLKPEVSDESIYLALIAIPFGFDFDQERMEIFASDRGGNSVRVPFRFRLRPYRQADTSPTLTRGFLERKVPELLPGYAAMAGVEIDSPASDEQSLLENFRIINEEYRTLLDQKLREILTPVRPEILWTQPFQRPLAAATSSNFGEKRTYRYQGREVSRSVHLGFDLADVRNAPVKSANDGIVVFEGDLGIYGNTVVVDHGLGLYSLYSHLNSIAVEEGQRIALGEELGRTGETGLAGGDHLHFEFRLGPDSVWAVEWWDPHWIEDQFWGKIKAVLAPEAES